MAEEKVAAVEALPWLRTAQPLSTHAKSWAAAASFMWPGILLAAVGVFLGILFLSTPNFAPPPGGPSPRRVAF